jgi:hypothetical protein
LPPFVASLAAHLEVLMKLDRTVKVGDLLVLLTIIISVATLAGSWSKDRAAREKEQANSVRAAAAKALTKLDRWQALYLSVFRDLQPDYVETSEMLVGEFNVTKARDHLWKTITARMANVDARVVDEQLKTAYVDVLAHFPAVRGLFSDAFEKLESVVDKTRRDLLVGTQDAVLGFKDKQASYMTAQLGNSLRKEAAQYEARFKSKTEEIIMPVRNLLLDIIGKSDAELLHVARTLPAS